MRWIQRRVARREWVVETWHEDALVETGVGRLPWMIPQSEHS